MKLKTEVSAFFKETFSSSLRYFCKKNNHTDIQKKNIFLHISVTIVKFCFCNEFFLLNSFVSCLQKK